MKTSKVILLFSFLTFILLTACESEKKADETSKNVKKAYEKYVLELSQQEPYNQFIEDVSVILNEKHEYQLHIGSSYSYDYHIEIKTNEQFLTLSPLEKFEQIYVFKKNLKNVAQNESPDENIESHDVLYIDKDFKHTIGKNDIYFISGSDQYGAYIHEMTPPEAYEYKGRGFTHQKILELNGEKQTVEVFQESFFDDY